MTDTRPTPHPPTHSVRFTTRSNGHPTYPVCRLLAHRVHRLPAYRIHRLLGHPIRRLPTHQLRRWLLPCQLAFQGRPPGWKKSVD